jgi:hypothetical protein
MPSGHCCAKNRQLHFLSTDNGGTAEIAHLEDEFNVSYWLCIPNIRAGPVPFFQNVTSIADSGI